MSGNMSKSSDQDDSDNDSQVVLEIKKQLDATIVERFKQQKESRLQEFKFKQQMDELKRVIERKDSTIIELKKSLERVRNIEFNLSQTQNTALSLREDNTKLKIQFQELERKYRALHAEFKIERQQRQVLEAQRQSDGDFIRLPIQESHSPVSLNESRAYQEVSDMKAEIDSLTKENEALQEQQFELKQYYDKEIEKLQQQLSDLEISKEKATQSLENEVDMYKQQLDDILADRDELERSLNDTQMERSQVLEKFEQFEQIRERERRSSTIYKSQVEKQIEEREQAIVDLNLKLDDTKKKLKDQSDKFIAMQKKYFMLEYQTDQKIAAQVKKANEKVKEFNQRHIKLMEDLHVAQKDRSMALSQVTWYKEENASITQKCKENKSLYKERLAEMQQENHELRVEMNNMSKTYEEELDKIRGHRDSQSSEMPILNKVESNANMAIMEEEKSDDGMDEIQNQQVQSENKEPASLGEQIIDGGFSGYDPPPRFERGSSAAESPFRLSLSPLKTEVDLKQNGTALGNVELQKENKDLKGKLESQKRQFMKEITSLQRNLRSAYVELQSVRRKSLMDSNPNVYLSPLDHGSLEKQMRAVTEERDTLLKDLLQSKGKWAEQNNFLTQELRRAEQVAVDAKMKCAQLALEKDTVTLRLRKLRQRLNKG